MIIVWGFKKMQNSRALRRGRYSIEGGHYLITVATRKRYPYFLSFEHACSASKSFYQPRVTLVANTLSYVVMPVRIPANVTGHSGDRDRFAHGLHAGESFVR
ncbi:hypothetical protein BDK62_1387 [Halomonas alkaliantarctica]|nr:hypothetical protein BDK62_1387 [Halomonas alkaliantarctica]